MSGFLEAFVLLFVLLNPFILSVYLVNLIRTMPMSAFADQLIKAAVISAVVFLIFGWVGESLFSRVLHVRFASFQIFGGLTFLVMGVRWILGAKLPIGARQPATGNVAGAIAIPFMVGPGTISASVIAGAKLKGLTLIACVVAALASAVIATLLVKWIHDAVRARNEVYIERYTEITGRAVALFTGTVAVDMILNGIDRWLVLRAAGVGA